MEKDYSTVCSMCGFPLEQKDVHGLVNGRLHVKIDDEQENVFNVNMHLCKECTRKLAMFTVMEVHEAVERIATLENYG